MHLDQEMDRAECVMQLDETVSPIWIGCKCLSSLQVLLMRIFGGVIRRPWHVMPCPSTSLEPKGIARRDVTPALGRETLGNHKGSASIRSSLMYLLSARPIAAFQQSGRAAGHYYNRSGPLSFGNILSKLHAAIPRCDGVFRRASTYRAQRGGV